MRPSGLPGHCCCSIVSLCFALAAWVLALSGLDVSSSLLAVFESVQIVHGLDCVSQPVGTLRTADQLVESAVLGAADSPNSDWMPCDGRHLSVGKYAELHAVVGDVFCGIDDGAEPCPDGYFALPNGSSPRATVGKRHRDDRAIGADSADRTLLTNAGVHAHEYSVQVADSAPECEHTHALESVALDSAEWFHAHRVEASLTTDSAGGGHTHRDYPVCEDGVDAPYECRPRRHTEWAGGHTHKYRKYDTEDFVKDTPYKFKNAEPCARDQGIRDGATNMYLMARWVSDALPFGPANTVSDAIGFLDAVRDTAGGCEDCGGGLPCPDNINAPDVVAGSEVSDSCFPTPSVSLPPQSFQDVSFPEATVAADMRRNVLELVRRSETMLRALQYGYRNSTVTAQGARTAGKALGTSVAATKQLYSAYTRAVDKSSKDKKKEKKEKNRRNNQMRRLELRATRTERAAHRAVVRALFGPPAGLECLNDFPAETSCPSDRARHVESCSVPEQATRDWDGWKDADSLACEERETKTCNEAFNHKCCDCIGNACCDVFEEKTEDCISGHTYANYWKDKACNELCGAASGGEDCCAAYKWKTATCINGHVYGDAYADAACNQKCGAASGGENCCERWQQRTVECKDGHVYGNYWADKACNELCGAASGFEACCKRWWYNEVCVLGWCESIRGSCREWKTVSYASDTCEEWKTAGYHSTTCEEWKTASYESTECQTWKQATWESDTCATWKTCAGDCTRRGKVYTSDVEYCGCSVCFPNAHPHQHKHNLDYFADTAGAIADDVGTSLDTYGSEFMDCLMGPGDEKYIPGYCIVDAAIQTDAELNDQGGGFGCKRGTAIISDIHTEPTVNETLDAMVPPSPGSNRPVHDLVTYLDDWLFVENHTIRGGFDASRYLPTADICPTDVRCDWVPTSDASELDDLPNLPNPPGSSTPDTGAGGACVPKSTWNELGSSERKCDTYSHESALGALRSRLAVPSTSQTPQYSTKHTHQCEASVEEHQWWHKHDVFGSCSPMGAGGAHVHEADEATTRTESELAAGSHQEAPCEHTHRLRATVEPPDHTTTPQQELDTPPPLVALPTYIRVAGCVVF
ncbi:MAG: hypothetical protein CMI16_16080 [Opitutaceae bacterium]|nr:hypothetical protein [Opitutaceae bacterium]